MPYGSLHLEVPPVTVADHCAAAVVAFAGAVFTWALVRQGHPVAAVASLGGTLLAVALLRRATRMRVPVRLERLMDGTLRAACRDSATPVPVAIQPQTKLLGRSVYVDFVYRVAGRQVRCRRWISPYDAPAESLRRWTVVLPRAGSVANS